MKKYKITQCRYSENFHVWEIKKFLWWRWWKRIPIEFERLEQAELHIKKRDMNHMNKEIVIKEVELL